MAKILGPKLPYVTLLDEVFRQRPAKEPYFPIRPSAAGYCERKLGFDLHEFLGYKKYVKPPLSPETQRIFDMGNAVERHALGYFHDLKLVDPAARIKYKQQVVTYLELDDVKGHEGGVVEGSTDLIVYMTDSKCVADVKSKKDKFSKSHKSDWDETIERLAQMKSTRQMQNKDGTLAPEFWVEDLEAFIDELWDPFFADNFYQLNAYALTEFFRERGVDHGLLYRYCKNDSRHLGIRFKPSLAVDKYVKNKFTRVWKTIAAGKKPDALRREYALGSMRCGFCDYAKYCWKGQDTKRAFFKTLKGEPRYARPLTELGISSKVGDMAQDVVDYKGSAKSSKAVEEKVVAAMLDRDIQRMRLSSGQVVELKFLKSPWEHYELRRVPR